MRTAIQRAKYARAVRVCMIGILMLMGLDRPAGGARQSTIAVLAAPEVEAYGQAIEGLKSRLRDPSVAVRVFALEKKGGTAGVPAALVKEQAAVVVAMGSEAAHALAVSPVDAPVFYTMALRTDAIPAGAFGPRMVATITLDVPMEALAAWLKEVFPDRRRLGVIRQKDSSDASSTRLQAEGRQFGLVVSVADCGKPEELIRVFLSFKDKVDFVWCLPDTSLYNSATVQGLLMASLNNRIPVVGFSASFVRAGALLGIYPDFRVIGGQTADAIQSYLANRPVPGVQPAREFELAVNQRVARLMGLQPAASKKAVVFR